MIIYLLATSPSFDLPLWYTHYSEAFPIGHFSVCTPTQELISSECCHVVVLCFIMCSIVDCVFGVSPYLIVNIACLSYKKYFLDKSVYFSENTTQ
jgi:hypothetical protein